MAIRKIEVESIQDKAYKILKHAILKNEIMPGERLVDVQLANEMGVSRTPIRDAIRMLEKDGLVENRGAEGYYVIRLSKEDINGIYDIRLMAETYTLMHVDHAEIMKNLKQYEQLMKEMGNIEDAVEDIIYLDERFHENIISASKNKILIEFYNTLCIQMRVYWQYIYSDSEYETQNSLMDSIHSHDAIIQAMEDNNIREAIRLLTEHINDSRNYALKRFDTVKE